METKSKGRPTLNVATALKRLVSALEAIGFNSVEARIPTMVMNLNDETQVTLYPGVKKHLGSVMIDPVIVLYNTKLKARLLSSRSQYEPRVCHAYLGMLDSWGRLYIDNDEELEQAVRQVVRSVLEVGLPIMREYDTVEKVRKLFRDDVSRTKQFPVAVLFAKEKLQMMEDH